MGHPIGNNQGHRTRFYRNHLNRMTGRSCHRDVTRSCYIVSNHHSPLSRPSFGIAAWMPWSQNAFAGSTSRHSLDININKEYADMRPIPDSILDQTPSALRADSDSRCEQPADQRREPVEHPPADEKPEPRADSEIAVDWWLLV